jgi:hypothetical protein
MVSLNNGIHIVGRRLPVGQLYLGTDPGTPGALPLAPTLPGGRGSHAGRGHHDPPSTSATTAVSVSTCHPKLRSTFTPREPVCHSDTMSSSPSKRTSA